MICDYSTIDCKPEFSMEEHIGKLDFLYKWDLKSYFLEIIL